MQTFTINQKKILLKNPNVLKLTENHLVFKPEFKFIAVNFYLQGMSPDEIFIAHDFNPSFFEPDYFRSCLKRWKIKIEIYGDDAFSTETRGRDSLGRPKNDGLENASIDDLRALVWIQKEMLEEIKKKKALAKKLSSK